MRGSQRDRVWLFDLDNTLHDATPWVFPHINRSMTDYISRHLGLDEAAACALRQRYWHRYGATLLGLMRHHDTDPQHFLRDTHLFPDLAAMLVFEKATGAALRRLPGRRILFSNAPRHYAEAVLKVTGIRPLFEAIYAIEQLRFRPKPDIAGFLHILRREGIAPEQAIMVEDSVENLAVAKRLGMKTVWIDRGLHRPPWVDVVLPSPRHLPRCVGRL